MQLKRTHFPPKLPKVTDFLPSHYDKNKSPPKHIPKISLVSGASSSRKRYLRFTENEHLWLKVILKLIKYNFVYKPNQTSTKIEWVTQMQSFNWYELNESWIGGKNITPGGINLFTCHTKTTYIPGILSQMSFPHVTLTPLAHSYVTHCTKSIQFYGNGLCHIKMMG